MMVSNKPGFFEKGDFFPQTLGLGLFGPSDQILQNIYPKLGVAKGKGEPSTEEVTPVL